MQKFEKANDIINEESEEDVEDAHRDECYKDWVYLCNNDHKVLKILLIYHDKFAIFNPNNKKKPLWYSHIKNLTNVNCSWRNKLLYEFVFS